MSNNGPFFLIKNFGCTQHSSSKLGSVFAGTKFKSFEYLAALNIVQVNLALYSLARNFFCFCILFISWISSCTRHSIQVNLMTLLSLARYFREKRVNGRFVVFYSSHHFYMFKRHVITQISQIYADKRQAGKWNYNYNNGRSRVSRGNI